MIFFCNFSQKLHLLGIQILNMKMVFNIYGTWRRVTFEKLMMKYYDFFIRFFPTYYYSVNDGHFDAFLMPNR